MFSTKNIYLAAIYIALGAEYSHANKDDIRHQKFIFKDWDVDANKIRAEYINGTLMINAADFIEAIQRMKSEIHSN